jgi:hypothetical protein
LLAGGKLDAFELRAGEAAAIAEIGEPGDVR